MPTDAARRRLLAGLLGLAVAGAWSRTAGAVADPVDAEDPEALPEPLLSAWRGPDDVHRLGCLHADAGLDSVALPFRGHGIAVHPAWPGSAVIAGRRPGRQLARVDLRALRIERLIDTGDGRHGGGHVAYTADGTRLLSGETDADRACGLIVVREPQTLAALAEWDAHGTEPHELLALPGGRLAVANGGLALDPATGRRVLNRGATDSSLVLLAAADGRRLGRWRLADREQSLRHLAVAPDGTLWIGLQHQSAAAGEPVLARLGRDGRLVACPAPPAVLDAAAAYCASLAVEPRSGVVAVTCTRGDRVLLYAADGAFLAAVGCAKPAGVCAAGGRLLVSSELGELLSIDPRQPQAARSLPLGRRWDNHLIAG